MTHAKHTDAVKERFDKVITGWEIRSPKRVYFELPPSHIKEFVNYMHNELMLRFIIASGTDTRRAIDITYHFADDATGTVFSAKVTLNDKKNLKIETISDIFIGASWIEREIHELLGVDFTGNSNLKHLLLHDNWPEGNYPLRHDND